jgi:hypothetical protein
MTSTYTQKRGDILKKQYNLKIKKGKKPKIDGSSDANSLLAYN